MSECDLQLQTNRIVNLPPQRGPADTLFQPLAFGSGSIYCETMMAMHLLVFCLRFVRTVGGRVTVPPGLRSPVRLRLHFKASKPYFVLTPMPSSTKMKEMLKCKARGAHPLTKHLMLLSMFCCGLLSR